MDLRRSVDHSKAPPSVFSGNSRTIIPRLKRYISEIAEITAKIIPPEDDVLEVGYFNNYAFAIFLNLHYVISRSSLLERSRPPSHRRIPHSAGFA